MSLRTSARQPLPPVHSSRLGLHFLLLWLCLALASSTGARPVGVSPKVSIIAPSDGAVFKSGSAVELAANASVLHGQIRRVDYYEGTNWLASSSRPEYRALWRNPSLGPHSLFAVAIDNHGSTNVSASVQIIVIPSNDNFSDAIVLTGSDVSVVGGTVGATLEDGEPDWNWGGPSVWYSWTAPAHGRVHLAMPDWSYGTYFGAYTGTTVSNLTLVADDLGPWGGWFSGFYFEVQAGTTYHILVAGAGGPVSPFTLDLLYLPKPANDNFEHRTTISASGGTATVDNFFATFQPGEPSDLSPIIVGYTASFHTVWWTWTAQVAGQVSIQPSCDFMHLLGLYSGLALSNLTTVTTIFNGGATLDVAAGTTLQISVDGVSGQTGVVNLNVGFTPTPSNDDFRNSRPVFGDQTTLHGNNTAATREPGEPQHAGVGSGRSVWWKWVAPASGYATLTPATNSAAPVVAVYTGAVLSNLTTVAVSPVGTVGFDAVEGRSYHIAVDGRSGWQGSFTLNLLLSTIRLTKPSPNALFYLGDPIVLAAATTPLDGNSREVDFFNGSRLLGSAQRAHATITWTNAELGAYALTASMTDRQGTIRRSKPVNIHVRPANDDFTNSFTIQGLNVVTNGTNLGASKESGEPSAGDPSADASVWYSWTAPVSGGVVVSIQENYFAGHPVGVYFGDSISNLVSLGESIYNFYPVSFVAHTGITYHIEVSGFSQNPPDGAGSFTLSLNQTPAPPNDDFANRIALSGSPLLFMGSNVAATSEPGEPGTGPSVWWSWTAPGTGSLYLNATGVSLGPVLTVFSGSSLSNLHGIGVAQPSWFYGTDSSGEIHVNAGVTYQISLSGTYCWPIGEATIHLSFVPSPPNDDFASRFLLSGSTAVSTSSNVTASAEPDETNSLGRTVWWSWAATNSGPVTIGTGGSSFIPWVAVYTGTAITNLMLVTNGISGFTFNALAGTNYAISVDANYYLGQVGQIQLTLVAGPPVNDNFTNRLTLSGASITVVGSTVGATEERLEPIHGGFPGSNSLWWTWTAPATGTLNISVTGDGFSPTWSVYTGTNLRTLTLCGDSYNWPWNVRSSGTMSVNQGTSYQIAVDGSMQIGSPAAGIVTLSLSLIGLPSNDNFTNRILLSGTSEHVTGNTSGATREPGEPDHAGYPGGHSIWWAWTAPTSGHVTLDAFGSAVTTLAAVYTGNSISGLTAVASGNATYASIEFDCDAGVSYPIALDHWYTDMFGAVNLNLVFSSVRLTSPTNEAVLHAPSELLLTATSTVWDGPVDQMDFLADGQVIGSATSVPYTLTWTNPPLGDHSMQARVTNSIGASRISPIVLIHNRPANDDFASRAIIVEDTAVLHASGINATLEPDEPDHGPVNWESVWWSWTAPASGRVTLSKPSDFAFMYVLIDVYTGAALTDLVLVTNTAGNGSGASSATIAFDAQQGTAYQIAVAGSFFDKGDVPITFSFARSSGGDTAHQPMAGATTPVLSQPERLSSTQITFILSATPGFTYTILASSNISLLRPTWFTLLSTNLSASQAIIQDNDATNNQRFYRVQVGP
jgi:hypothetical protein